MGIVVLGDGNLVEMKKIESLQPIAVNREDLKPGEPYAESETSRVSFKLVVPQGRYYVYAVANLDLDLLKYEESIQTREGLKEYLSIGMLGRLQTTAKCLVIFRRMKKCLPRKNRC